MEQCVQRATEDADHRVHVADRVLFCATSFITNNLGWRCRAAHAGLQTVVGDSSTKMPLIFVLSPGLVPVKFVLLLLLSFWTL
jgi:hypothetical protein